MGGGGGGAVGLWPDTRSGGGVLSDSGPKRRAGEEGGGGGGGCCRFLARYEGRGGEYDRVSGGPGYSTVVEFMRADINRQRNRAAIL